MLHLVLQLINPPLTNVLMTDQFGLDTVVLDMYERCHIKSWRHKATAECLEHIQADDTFTKGISIGPVSRF